MDSRTDEEVDCQTEEHTVERTERERDRGTDGDVLWLSACELRVLVGGGGGVLAIRRTGLIRRVDGGCWASIGL